MTTFSGTESLSIPCVKCGHEVPVTISQLERHPDVVCPKCGTKTNFFAVDGRRDPA